MEYTKGKGIFSKLFKSPLVIGTFIVLLITIPYIAFFVIKALFPIVIFGVLVWYAIKLVKGITGFICKLGSKKDAVVNADITGFDADISSSIDINYEDSVIVDVDYEKVI